MSGDTQILRRPATQRSEELDTHRLGAGGR